MPDFVDRLAKRLNVRKPFLYAGGAAIALGIVSLIFRRKSVAAGPPFAYPSFLTGRKLTNASVSADGFVHADPRELARQAGSDIETYTVARTLASETSGPPIEKAAIAWAIRNYRDLKKRSIFDLGTKNGLYGKQAKVGFMATSKDPTDKDLHVATMVLAGAWPDPTRGSIQWFHPADQNAIFAKGESSVDAQGLIAKRRSEGREPVYIDGAPKIVMFRLA